MLAWALFAVLPAVTISKITISEDGRLLTDVELATFINAARCECDATVRVKFDVTAAGDTGSLVVVSGKRCVDSEGRISSSCETLSTSKLSGLRQVDFEVGISEITSCSGTNGTSGTGELSVLVDPNDEDDWEELQTLALPIDTKGPPPPEKAKAIPGEGLTEVVFERPDSEETIQYQVLCERAGEAVFDDPPEAAFVSSYDLCGAGTSTISKRFVCGEASGGTDSVTILELEDGVTYRFYAITVDAFGNPSSVAAAGKATPAPENDLWELYKKNGGTADGGHCFVATAAFGDYDDPQVVVLRDFRDRVLAKSELGRGAIAFYYDNSPPLAAWIARSPLRRRAAQLVLWPVAFVAGGLTP